MDAQALVMLLGLLAVVLMQGQSYLVKVAPVASSARLRKACLALLEGEKAENIIELGSGWGGMTTALSKAYPQASVTGYERSFLPLWWGRMAHGRNPAIHTMNADIFAADMTGADIVFCYLSPWHMAHLTPRFEADMKKGSLVLSAAFPILGHTPVRQGLSKGVVDIPVYLYRW